jgi:hypothetical protein
MQPRGLTLEQREAIAELLVAAKRFWLAELGLPENQASANLVKAFERFAKAID